VLCFSLVLFRLVNPKLSASLDCHCWIALWYSLTFSYRRLTFLPNCIRTPTFSAKHNNLASVVWHTSLMLFYFNTVTTNFNGEGEIYPYRSLRIVVCLSVPLLSFFGPLYYLSFFDLRIAITLWYISPLTYVWSSFLVKNMLCLIFSPRTIKLCS
jgi:hypothetical protein